MTYPRSPGNLTPEHEGVTVMPVQLPQGHFDCLPKWPGGGQLAQHPGAPKLCVCTGERSPWGCQYTRLCGFGQVTSQLGEVGLEVLKTPFPVLSKEAL